MSDNITESRIRKYSAGIDHLSQQTMTRLRSLVRVETDVQAKMTLWDQLGDIELEDKTSRHQPTPTMEAPHERRALFTKVRHGGVLVDETDLETILNDPTAHYGQMLAMSAGRKTDRIIIAAATGTAKTGEEGSTDVSMLGGNEIAHGTAGMTQAKVLEAKQILDEHEVNELIPRNAAAMSEQFTDLLSESNANVISSDFNVVKALVKGEINEWVGFQWVRSQLLIEDATPDRLCLFWAQDGILLGVAGDIRIRVGEREDLSYDGQVYLRMNMGATRLEEKKVVSAACQEA